MPWGWECRAKLVKQNPAKPTVPRGKMTSKLKSPAPNAYAVPPIVGGKGFGKIKRAPDYTFGHNTKINFTKPVTTPFAPVFNVQGMSPNGPFKITHGVVTPQIEPPYDKTKVPGPGAHAPRHEIRYRRPPAYSMRPAARPPYQAWDQWTPPPNMYWPPIPAKKPPAYTLGSMGKGFPDQSLPGPGEHEPNFNYVKKNKPSYTFGYPFKPIKPPKTPPPNTYCNKKFMVSQRSIPAPSFGIRHSRYLGETTVFEKSSKLDISLKSA